jgi:hypothetical protein
MEEEMLLNVNIVLRPLGVLKEKIKKNAISKIIEKAKELMVENARNVGWGNVDIVNSHDGLEVQWVLHQKDLKNIPMYYLELELVKTRRLESRREHHFKVEQDETFLMYMEPKVMLIVFFKAFLANTFYKEINAFGNAVGTNETAQVGNNSIKDLFCFKRDPLERLERAIVMEITIEEGLDSGKRNILGRDQLVDACSEEKLGPDICVVISQWNRTISTYYSIHRRKFLTLLKNTVNPDVIYLPYVEERKKHFQRLLTASEKTRKQLRKEFRLDFFDLTFEYFLLQGNLVHVGEDSSGDDLYDWED